MERFSYASSVDIVPKVLNKKCDFLRLKGIVNGIKDELKFLEYHDMAIINYELKPQDRSKMEAQH